jgi:ribosomal protein S12 methylthiotransferase accessory factor
MQPARRLVYRCLENLIKLDEIENYRRSLNLMFGEATVRQAEALLNRTERYFGLLDLGVDMEGSAMHQTLLLAYDKLFV